MPTQKNTVILFEYDTPVDRDALLPAEAGIFAWRMKNTLAGYTDNYGVTGYYEYQQPFEWLVRSVKWDSRDFAELLSMADLRITEDAFFFDQTTFILYIHAAGGEPLLAKKLILGITTGFSYNATDPYYRGFFYEPRLQKIPAIKKSVDPLFFGLLKYQPTTLRFTNNDGYFDDWRTRNLYGQKARVLIGEEGAEYADFVQIFEGFIEDDERSFTDFSLKIQDPRKGLTQPVGIHYITTAEYPNVDDSEVDKVKPVAYGTVYNRPAIRLDARGGQASYPYLVCDTTYNDITGPVTWYNPEKNTSGTTTATKGVITLTAAQSQDTDGNLTDIFVSFSCGPSNGVDIIKNLMLNYDGKTYIASFWDTAEVNASQALAWNTSLYIDDDTELAKCIESVCADCNLRFFAHDDGRYTIRVYDETRAQTKTIHTDDWIDDPAIANNGSEYLTSCAIQYKYDGHTEKYSTYTDTTREAEAYDVYKKYKSKTFETGLYELTAAQSKGAVIMEFSSNVRDVITRSLPWAGYYDLEIGDFVFASPLTRVGAAESWATYEILGVEKNTEKMLVKVTMQKATDEKPIIYAYNSRVTDTGNYRMTSGGDIRVTQQIEG